MRGLIPCRRCQGAGRGHGHGDHTIEGGRSEGRGGEIRIGGDRGGVRCSNRGFDYKVEKGLIVKEVVVSSGEKGCSCTASI